VQAFNTVLVRTQVDGKLMKIDFTEGQEVAQGSVVAKIDPTLYQAQYDQAIAKKALDEAQLADARLDLQRYRWQAPTRAQSRMGGPNHHRDHRAGVTETESSPDSRAERAKRCRAGQVCRKCNSKQDAPNRSNAWRASMRFFIFILAQLVLADSAAAQGWQEYSYPDYSFRVTFPAAPRLDATTYQIAEDRAVEAHVYSVRRDNAEFSVTVAELADSGLAETAVVDYAIKMLSDGGQVKVNIPHRINRVFGRQLSILGADGSRAAVALFDFKNRCPTEAMRRQTASASCNPSYSPAAAPTGRPRKFAPPSRVATKQAGLQSREQPPGCRAAA
jgi:hypothetical protein